MQTFAQSFAANQTWRTELSGRYFNVLQATNTVTVRLYKQGKLLDLGAVSGLGAGLEIFDVDFDRVEVDVTGPDTVKIGIGNGHARYSPPANATRSVITAMTSSNPAVGVASGVLLAANANRQYLTIQNKDAGANVYVTFAVAATIALGLRIPPGGSITMEGAQSSQAINAIADVATTNVVVVEG